MKNQKPDDTAPIPVQPASREPEPAPEKPAAGKKAKRGKWILFGILGILVLSLIGSGIGYEMAISKRKAAELDRNYVVATTQYELALQDQRNGNLSMALSRVEYVMTVYPQFPGIDDKLKELLLAIGTSTTPIASSPVDIPTAEPTKDTRAVSDLFQTLQTQYTNQQWEDMLSTVRSIRDSDPSYEVIKVDDMYYGALRNDSILQIQKGNLETGLYDMALAETMAPVDTDAEAYRTWARMYLTGASWWNINWEKVTLYFSQLNNMVPDLIDFSGMTVRQRYTKALELWGDQFAASGDYCSAVPKYQASLQVTYSKAMEDKISAARTGCESQPPATETPQPTSTGAAPTP